MSNKLNKNKTEAPTVEKEQVPETVEETKPEKREDTTPKFPYDVLKQKCVSVFGVTSSTFEAATIGMEDGSYSVEEMKTTLNKWLHKKIG